MAFQPVIDTVEIAVMYTQYAEPMQNLFYAELPGGYVQADLVILATNIDLAVGGAWLPDQTEDATYDRTEIRGLAVPNDLMATENASSGVGGELNPGLPGQVTFSVKKLSGFTGRSARGRTYWIGMPRTKIGPTDENIVLASYVTAMVANVDNIRTVIDGLSLWDPVLVSRFADGAKRSAGELFPWIGCVAIDDRVDTQRGRLS